jgi:hypothetical protein
MNTNINYIWYRIELTILLITVIAIPGVVWYVNSFSENQKIKLEYVRLAVGLLQPTEEGKTPQKELRSWAVDILQESSPVKLSHDAVTALIEGEHLTCPHRKNLLGLLTTRLAELSKRLMKMAY